MTNVQLSSLPSPSFTIMQEMGTSPGRAAPVRMKSVQAVQDQILLLDFSDSRTVRNCTAASWEHSHTWRLVRNVHHWSGPDLLGVARRIRFTSLSDSGDSFFSFSAGVGKKSLGRSISETLGSSLQDMLRSPFRILMSSRTGLCWEGALLVFGPFLSAEVNLEIIYVFLSPSYLST